MLTVTENMIKDMQLMAEYEAHTKIDTHRAHWIIKKILARAEERDDMYRITTARLIRLVAESARME